MSRETRLPAAKWGNPANGVCQPAWGKWVVKEESECSCCQLLCFGKEGPSNWHEMLCCLPGAAAATPQLLFQASQVMNSKETFTEQARTLCRTQEQANNICFSISNNLSKNKEGCLQIRNEDFGSGDAEKDSWVLAGNHLQMSCQCGLGPKEQGKLGYVEIEQASAGQEFPLSLCLAVVCPLYWYI